MGFFKKKKSDSPQGAGQKGQPVESQPPQKSGGILSVIKNSFVRLVRNLFALFTFIMIVIMLTPLANYMVAPLKVPMEIKSVDLIAVLGGGAYPNGTLTGASNERLIHGLRLYKAGLAPEIVFAGGSILDMRSKLNDTVGSGDEAPGLVPDVVEARIMADISLELGLSKRALYVDEASTNTYENIRAVKALMKKKGLSTCLVVTSPTHIFRAKLVYERLNMKCYPAPTGDYTNYIESPTGRLSLMRAVLWEYASIVLYKFLGYI